VPMVEDFAPFFDVDEFATRLRWTDADDEDHDITGIIDLEAEFYGPDSDVPMLIKTVTVPATAIPAHSHGDVLTVLTNAGVATSTTYKLQRTLSNDGAIKTIEITA